MANDAKIPLTSMPPRMQHLLGVCASKGTLRVPVDVSELTDAFYMGLRGLHFTNSGFEQCRRRGVALGSPRAMHEPTCAAYETAVRRC